MRHIILYMTIGRAARYPVASYEVTDAQPQAVAESLCSAKQAACLLAEESKGVALHRVKFERAYVDTTVLGEDRQPVQSANDFAGKAKKAKA